MATITLIPLDEYLARSYRPDVEHLDGALRERPMVQHVHGRLQVLIGTWFANHEDQWSLEAAVEVRTLVSSGRVRLPDVVLCRPGNIEQTLTKPPVIVIEILSPDDSYAETQRLAMDYQIMGVENIWLIEPEHGLVAFAS